MTREESQKKMKQTNCNQEREIAEYKEETDGPKKKTENRRTNRTKHRTSPHKGTNKHHMDMVLVHTNDNP